MKLAHRVSLGGVQLDEIDERILIKAVEVGAGKETVTAVSTGSGDGTRVTGKRRDSVEVQVKFSMNIRRDNMEARGELLEQINAWALQGGWLRVNYKPNRRLWADEVAVPGEGDLWKRLTEYTITFRAHAVPYWTEETPGTGSTGVASAAAGSLMTGGSAEAVADAILENRSGAMINSASITIAGKTMTFASLGLDGSERLEIDHVITQGKNVIRIRIRNAQGQYRSVLEKRSGPDEFTVKPGDTAFSFEAQRACRLTVNVRGRYA